MAEVVKVASLLPSLVLKGTKTNYTQTNLALGLKLFGASIGVLDHGVKAVHIDVLELVSQLVNVLEYFLFLITEDDQ